MALPIPLRITIAFQDSINGIQQFYYELRSKPTIIQTYDKLIELHTTTTATNQNFIKFGWNLSTEEKKSVCRVTPSNFTKKKKENKIKIISKNKRGFWIKKNIWHANEFPELEITQTNTHTKTKIHIQIIN